MTAVTPFIALAIFVVIVIIAILVAFTSNPDSHEKTRTRIFLTTLAALGIVITFMFYYNVVELQQEQQLSTILEQTKNVNESILETLLVEVRKGTAIAPYFILSLFPLTPCSNSVETDDPNTAEVCIEKMIISQKIFGVWQLYLQASYFISGSLESYLTGFLQQARSIKLKEYWELCKYNYDPSTRELGEMLFDTAADIHKQTAKSYAKASARLVKTPQFKRLLRNK